MNELDLDFSALLGGLSLLTGIIWAVYAGFFEKKRKVLGKNKEPIVVEYAKSFFPVLFTIFILRAFIAEPFRIPSDSMMPTLLDGDFILVNKFAYGVRFPVWNKKFIEVDSPKRGEIVVFRYPAQSDNDPDKGHDFIKRVIGVPGDTITYRNRIVYVNGKAVLTEPDSLYGGESRSQDYRNYNVFKEHISDEITHEILLGRAPRFNAGPEGTWTVGEHEYLVMGDNRSNSRDGRIWGMMPEENLVGKAFFIWMNWDPKKGGIQFSRIGSVLK